VMNKIVSVLPAVYVPIGLDEGPSVFRIAFIVNLGRR
jgi:hypothetical protein